MEPQITNSRATGKDFFLYLGLLITIHATVISLISLLFALINKALPDPLLNQYAYSVVNDSYNIRMAMAVLIIAFPVHAILSWFIERDIARMPEKLTIWTRRWFSYIVLFAAGVTLAIDLIVLVNKFLQGDLTSQFIFKAIALILIVGTVFMYYLWNLRGANNRRRYFSLHLIVSAIVIIAVIVWGFAVVGMPANQRLVRFDEARINNLSLIQNEVVSYWQFKRFLPTSLADLSQNTISGFKAPVDPETNAPYEYKKVSELKFELCATFNTDSVAQNNGLTVTKPMAVSDYYGNLGNWDHSTGRVCFERTIDPAFYPPVTNKN